MNRSRREFLKSGMAGSAAAMFGLTAGGAISATGTGRIQITTPREGTVFGRGASGGDGTIRVDVEGTAPAGTKVVVQGHIARREGERFSAKVTLSERESRIVAVCREGTGEKAQDAVRVLWDKGSKPRYRVAIDDNGFFLRDVVQKGYKSLFECPYLKMLRDLHAKYKSTFVLNCFYALEDGFKITEFPEKYKGEWKDNADWLKLAFHSYAEFPNRPYQNATPEKILADWDLLTAQLIRIGGEEAYSPTTVIHWGMTPVTAFKPLASRGVTTLSGYFRPDAKGAFDVNYCMDAARSEFIYENDRWHDFDSGITFSKIDMIINCTLLEKIVPTLETVYRDARQNEVIDLLTHEQYFWPFYKGYLPDHPQRMDAALRWVTEKGYEPVWLHEGLLGNIS